MTAAERLAVEISDHLARRGGFVVIQVAAADGPVLARVEVVDPSDERRYSVTVEELAAGDG